MVDFEAVARVIDADLVGIFDLIATVRRVPIFDVTCIGTALAVVVFAVGFAFVAVTFAFVDGSAFADFRLSCDNRADAVTFDFLRKVT